MAGENGTILEIYQNYVWNEWLEDLIGDKGVGFRFPRVYFSNPLDPFATADFIKPDYDDWHNRIP